MATAVYADASGSEHDQAAQIVAGFSNSIQNWADFAHQWKEFLRRRGMSALHMTGPSEPWKSDPIIREAVKSEAIEIIQRSGAVSFVALTVSDDFNAFKAEKEAQGFEVPNAYVFTALKFVVQIHGWHSDNRMAQPSEFIFEAGDPGQKRILGEILKDYGLPQPIFRKKTDQDDQHAIVALEAADFLGYEMLRALKDTLRLGLTERPYLESFGRMEHKWTSVTKDLMDLLLPISAAQHHLERIAKEGQ